jgi:hypothetical protein
MKLFFGQKVSGPSILRIKMGWYLSQKKTKLFINIKGQNYWIL